MESMSFALSDDDDYRFSGQWRFVGALFHKIEAQRFGRLTDKVGLYCSIFTLSPTPIANAPPGRLRQSRCQMTGTFRRDLTQVCGDSFRRPRSSRAHAGVSARGVDGDNRHVERSAISTIERSALR